MLRTLNETDQAELVLMLLDIKDLEEKREDKHTEESECYNKHDIVGYRKISQELCGLSMSIMNKHQEVVDFLNKKLLG